MQPIQTPNKLYFAVQIFDQMDGRKIQALRPDEDGYYDVTVAMLDSTSRNDCYYDPDSIMKEVTSPSTIFNMMLTQGNLKGEFGHPPMGSPLERIDAILEERVSHHISKIWTGERISTGIPVYAKVAPSGPYGDCLEKSLLSSKENTTFSLRCLMSQRPDPVNKRMYRIVKRLVTFDFVTMPGYKEASKWYAPGTENLMGFTQEITPYMLFDRDGNRVGLESFSDQDLADMFGITDLQLNDIKLGTYIKGGTTYFGIGGNKRSLTKAILTNLKR